MKFRLALLLWQSERQSVAYRLAAAVRLGEAAGIEVDSGTQARAENDLDERIADTRWDLAYWRTLLRLAEHRPLCDADAAALAAKVGRRGTGRPTARRTHADAAEGPAGNLIGTPDCPVTPPPGDALNVVAGSAVAPAPAVSVAGGCDVADRDRREATNRNPKIMLSEAPSPLPTHCSACGRRFRGHDKWTIADWFTFGSVPSEAVVHVACRSKPLGDYVLKPKRPATGDRRPATADPAVNPPGAATTDECAARRQGSGELAGKDELAAVAKMARRRLGIHNSCGVVDRSRDNATVSNKPSDLSTRR